MNHYSLFDSIASGGMGTVHYGRATGGAGLSRIVAIKRMHGDLARDPVCLAMFQDELRMAARVRHPNVVATLDMVEQDNELLLVMEYVQGESLQDLIARTGLAGQAIPPAIAVSIVCGILQGLEAAHDAKSEAGEPLRIVHRDVSPENILVGRDGIARLLDFGIARAAGRKHVTRVGEIKGKPSYLAPEQILDGGKLADRRADVYGAAVVLWEALTGQRLFDGQSPASTLSQVLTAVVQRPSSIVGSLPEGLDEVVMRGLSRNPDERFATALEMARALGRVCNSLLPFEVGEWVEATAPDSLARQAKHVAWLESFDVKPSPEPVEPESPFPVRNTPPESIRITMSLTPRSTAPRRPLLHQLSSWLETAPRLQQGLFAVAVATCCFLAGVVVVRAATARPHAAAPAVAMEALEEPVLAPAAPPLVSASPVALPAPVATPAPADSAAASDKPKKKKHAPPVASAPRRPVIDDGF